MANNRIDKINVGGADYDLGSTNFVFDTYAEYRAAYSAGDIPVGSVVYIKEGSTDNTITALQVVYNNGTVKSALDKLNNDLANSNNRIGKLEAIALSETRVAINCNTAVSGVTPFGYKGTSLSISSGTNDKIYAVTIEKPSSGDWVFSIDVNQTNRTITVYANGSATVYADVIYRHDVS